MFLSPSAGVLRELPLIFIRLVDRLLMDPSLADLSASSEHAAPLTKMKLDKIPR